MMNTNHKSRRASEVEASGPAVMAVDVGDAEADKDLQAELRVTIQDLRRQTTEMAADLFKMDELRASRDHVTQQLEEARIEIRAINDRRKEMARVIADRNAKIEALSLQLEEARSKILASNDRKQELALSIADRKAKIEDLSLRLKEARSKILASNERRGEMARVIANRNAKIEALNRTNELQHVELQDISAEFKSREVELQALCDKLEVRLQDTRSKLVTSQARRKEMALVIDKRGAAIADLQRQVESAHEQVATLDRHVRSSVTWWLTKMNQ